MSDSTSASDVIPGLAAHGAVGVYLVGLIGTSGWATVRTAGALTRRLLTPHPLLPHGLEGVAPLRGRWLRLAVLVPCLLLGCPAIFLLACLAYSAVWPAVIFAWGISAARCDGHERRRTDAAAPPDTPDAERRSRPWASS